MRVLPLSVVAIALCCSACEATKDILLGPEVQRPEPVAAAPAPPTPSPTFAPEPTIPPTPTPTPNPDPGRIPPNVPDNTNAVDHVHLVVTFLECAPGEVTVPGHVDSAAVGCRVHYDATPKDKSGRHTRSYLHEWSTAGPAQFGGLGSMTPTAKGTSPGLVTMRVYVDGVWSNVVNVTFY